VEVLVHISALRRRRCQWRRVFRKRRGASNCPLRQRRCSRLDSRAWLTDHDEPSVDKGQVYITSEKGIVAIRRELGTLKWEYSIEHGAGETMPLPIGDRVFTSGYDGNSYALHRDTGAVVWKAGFLSDAPPDPPEFDGKRARFQKILARPRGAACDGKIFVQCVFDQCRVIAMDCAGGKRLWSFGTGGWTDGVPTIVGDKVYITSQDRNLYCLEHDSGRLLWTFETKSWLSSQAGVEKEIVFLPHHRGRLYQIAAKTGEQLKLFEAEDLVDRESLVGSCPMISKGIVYFATVKGQVYAVDIDSGKVKWKLRPAPGSELGMAATDGRRIFVTCHKTIDKAGEYSIVALGKKK
jgi:outer membrane protein assembly factor BamB